MSEQDHEAGKLDKPVVVLGVMFIANNQSTKVIQPGEEPFDFPTALDSPQRTPVLSDSIRPAAVPMWSDHVRTELVQHLLVQRVTVVGLISNEALRHIGNETLLQRLVNQLYFSRASTVCAYGDRKTIAVCNCHDLGALAAFSL